MPLLDEGCLPADGGPEISVPMYVSADPDCRGSISLSTPVGRFSAPEPMGGGVFISKFFPPDLKEGLRTTWRVDWTGPAGKSSSAFEVELCPHPAGRVKVAAEPDSLLAGQGQQAILTIEASDERGSLLDDAPLEISVNVGEIRHLRRVGNGQYQAVYLPPDDPFPQVAIIMVANPQLSRFGRVAAGRAVIPITARIKLPGKTIPGTSISMDVAGRSFGPLRAERDGKFEIPILVPPGVQRGQATSIDQAGNRKSRWVDFFLPPTNQLGLWAYPRRICADGASRARLLITTMDATGRPVDVEKVRFDASLGTVEVKRRLDRGLLEAYFTSPKLTAGGTAQLKVRFPEGGPRSEATVEIELLSGLAESLAVAAPPSLIADGKSTFEVEVRVLDREGKTVGGKMLQAECQRLALGQPVEVSPGVHRLGVTARPDPARWEDTLKLTVTEQVGKQPARIVVAPDCLRRDGDSVQLLVFLVDDAARPVPEADIEFIDGNTGLSGKTDDFGAARFTISQPAPGGGASRGRPRRIVLSAAAGTIRRHLFLGGEGGALRLLPLGLDSFRPLSEALTREVFFQLYPPAPLVILLEARPAPSGWLVMARALDAQGQPAEAADIEFSVSQGRIHSRRKTAPGTFEATADPGKPGWKKMFVSAGQAGVASGAVIEIDEPEH